MPGQHAFLPPSGADGWMTCPAWPWLNAQREDDGDTEWSAEGTAAHSVREMALKHDLDAHDFIWQKRRVGKFEFEVTEEMCNALQPGIDEIRSYGGQLIVEQRLYFDEWLPKGQFGHLDAGIITPEWIIISDLKYGQGVPVSPIWNKQLLIYAAGFWWRFARHRTKAKKIRIIIDQPRHSDGGGIWDTTVDEMLHFMETKVAKAARRVWKEPKTRVASDKGCRFCPDRRDCAVYEKYMLDQAVLDFDDVSDMKEVVDLGLTPRNPYKRLSDEQKVFLIKNKSLIVDWIDGMHAEALNDALRGRPWDGTRVEYGRAPKRNWKDEKAAKKFLLARLPEDEVVVTEMISVAVAEDKLATSEREKLKPLWTQGEAKPVLSFKEPSAKKDKSYPTVIDEFDDESDPM